MRRLIAAIMIASTAALIMATSQGASAADSVAQADFVGKINATRASEGAGPLQAHPMLTAKAQAWAAHMAATGCLCHSNLTDGISGAWSKLGENVGRGPNVASLHNAFINSPEHHANMVDRSFQWVGVGVAYGGGQMWVAEVFMNGVGPAPAPPKLPIGSLDLAVRGPGVIGVHGWTLDPDTTNPLAVHIYVDGRGVGATTANQARADIGRLYPHYGPAHGYSANVAVSPGDHRVCTYAINQYNGASNPQLGCLTVRNTPMGHLDGAKPSPSGTSVGGWALGPDVTNPLAVHLYFNGHIVKAVSAGASRPDVGRAYPAFGSGHGFTAAVPNQNGLLCAYAINGAGNGNNPLIGCRWVDTNPFGRVDGAGRWGGGVRVRGWAMDPDTTGAVTVHVYIDGRPAAAVTAASPRADLAAAFSAYSTSHSFDTVVPLGPGLHSVCAYAINRGSGSGNPLLGCQIVG
jgi:Cysteine-rich secretory protein family